MRINQNMSALNSLRNLGINDARLTKSLERLSSGLRINRAADDAAGLTISEKMRGQVKGLQQAQRNANDAISMIGTAEGGLNETHSILQRMRELAVQASNDVITTQDRGEIQKEVDQLGAELKRISDTTEFNTKKLLNGDLAKAQAAAQATKISSAVIKDASGGAAATAAAKLNLIQDSNGNGLGIHNGDVITIEGTLNGTYKSTTLTVVSGTTTLAGIMTGISGQFAGLTGSVAISSGVITTTGTVGATNTIGGLTITAKDSTGVERSAFNNWMSKLTKTQDALDVHADTSATLQIGANSNQSIVLDVYSMDTTALGVAGISVNTQTSANIAIKTIDDAIQKVSAERSKLGALQNRLEHTINNLGVSAENIQAAESRVRDVDMAAEMSDFTKSQILSQASTAMLAQANQKPQSILKLLG